jgi:hypothetical protein
MNRAVLVFAALLSLPGVGHAQASPAQTPNPLQTPGPNERPCTSEELAECGVPACNSARTASTDCLQSCTDSCVVRDGSAVCTVSSCGESAGMTCKGSAECPTQFCEMASNCGKECTDLSGFTFTCNACPEEPAPPEQPGGGPPPPPAPGTAPSFEQGRCHTSFVQIQSLCITPDVQKPLSFANAQVNCRRIFGTSRVANYADYRFIFLTISGRAFFNPDGLWLGIQTGDNLALFGNRPVRSDTDPNIGDFDGEGSRFDPRGYRCAYDLIPAEQVITSPMP